jgi:K(+)-stimulated pyrophosphate-energized sodium pump
MKVVFKIKEDDARNPGVIADCTGDNAATPWARRPTASRRTAVNRGVALISFILLAVKEPTSRSNSWSGSSRCAS